jgi:hypothetical protein
MNLMLFRLTRILLVAGLVSLNACGERKAANNELIGEWLGRSVTVKRAGHADETKAYKENELAMKFSADGTFVIEDRGVPNEQITMRGTYELPGDHRLKETIVDVTGAKFATDGMKGHTSNLEYDVSSDQLKIVRRMNDQAGNLVATTESTFVRAPK